MAQDTTGGALQSMGVDRHGMRLLQDNILSQRDKMLTSPLRSEFKYLSDAPDRRVEGGAGLVRVELLPEQICKTLSAVHTPGKFEKIAGQEPPGGAQVRFYDSTIGRNGNSTKQ